MTIVVVLLVTWGNRKIVPEYGWIGMVALVAFACILTTIYMLMFSTLSQIEKKRKE